MAQPRRIALVAAAAVVAIGVVLAAFLVGGGDDKPIAGTPLRDETGRLTMSVPHAWSDIDTATFTSPEGREGPRIQAGPDRRSYVSRLDGPGVDFLFIDDATGEHVASTLDKVGEQSKAETICERSERRAFDHRGFKGSVDVHEGCGDTRAEVWVVAAKPPDVDGLAVVSVQAATDAERDLIFDSMGVANLSR